jgi:hypothetical protein
VCSTMIFAGLCSADLFSSNAAAQKAPRSKKAFKYPPPATSTRAIPSTGPSPVAISCAIIRGAFFNLFANSKQTGEAASPISIFGGRSNTTANSTPYFSRMCRSSASRNRFESVRYTRPLSRLPARDVIQYKRPNVPVQTSTRIQQSIACAVEWPVLRPCEHCKAGPFGPSGCTYRHRSTQALRTSNLQRDSNTTPRPSESPS